MAHFSLARERVVAAPIEHVHAFLDDFRAWQSWSPWEGVDPDMARTFSGPERGVGSRYHWSGNKKAGEGDMVITASDPRHVVLDLHFLKPFRAEYAQSFDLTPVNDGAATHVVWTMTGTRNPLMHLLGKLFFDKAIGGDFDRGLTGLKAAAEA